MCFSCVFGLGPCFLAHSFKTLGISQVMGAIKLSCVMLMRWLQELTRGWGLFARRTDHVIRVLELSVPPSDLQVGERGWRWSSFTNGQWFNQSCLCNEASLKTQKSGFRELPSWWTCGGAGRVMSLVWVWKLWSWVASACSGLKQDLSSPTRDWRQAAAVRVLNPSH